MSFAISAARLLTLTSRASDLQYRIMIVTNREQRLAYQTQSMLEQYNQGMQQQAMMKGQNPQENVGIYNEGQFAAQYEALMAGINAKQKSLEMERTQLETQHKAIEQEKESTKKLLDKNAKSFAILK